MSWGRSVYFAHVSRHSFNLVSDLWLALQYAFTRNPKHMIASNHVCFVLESCAPDVERLEHYWNCLVQQKALLRFCNC